MRSRKQIKKILASLLAVVLMCSTLPVYAVEETEDSVPAAQEEEETWEDSAGDTADADSGSWLPRTYSYTAYRVPNTSLSFSASDGVPSTVIRSTMESLISSHEGSSTSINKNDNGTVSIGRLQFRGGLALELMRLVVAADANTAYNVLGDALYYEITDPSTSWAARPVNDAEAAALSNLLGTAAALAVQDNYVNSLLSMYLNQAYREGFRNVPALLYYGDICNHLGMNYGTQFGQYAINLAGSADAVTANEFHIATICCIYNMYPSDAQRYNVEYIPLKRTVYSNIVNTANANGWAYCQSGDSMIPCNADGTNGTRWLKRALDTYMNAGLVVNDTYDAATTAAVKTFQAAEGLTQNGMADEKTSSLLIYRIYDNKAQTGGAISVIATIEKIDGEWIYTVNGVPDYTYTGLVRNENGWWYVQNGKVDFSYTGLVKNENGWWYVVGGKVDFSYTGLAKNGNDWWYVNNGQVDYSYTGLVKNENGWWYVKDGQVDFSYTGIAQNSNGWWYVQNGKVNFDYTGEVEVSGKTYVVEGGRVTGYAAPAFTVTRDETSATVSWEAVGAEKYRVFRKTYGDSWEPLADTDSNSYTDDTQEAGTSYYYTVRCIDTGGTVYTSSYIGGYTGSDLVGYVRLFLGNLHVWDGLRLPDGRDDSEFASDMYGHFGVSMPHYSRKQAEAGRAVSYADAQEGDLIFYDTNEPTGGHIGIYIGNGRMISAKSTADGICIHDVDPSASGFTVRRLL